MKHCWRYTGSNHNKTFFAHPSYPGPYGGPVTEGEDNVEGEGDIGRRNSMFRLYYHIVSLPLSSF